MLTNVFAMIDFQDRRTTFWMLTLLALCAFSVWGYAFFQHDIFEEWDGVMHYYSGQIIWDKGIYIGWASHFWPPLQPLLVGFGKNPLLIGKVLALLSGVSILFCTYFLLIGHGVSKLTAFIGVLFLLTNKHFLLQSIQVENHALEAAFFIGGVLVFSFFLKKPDYKLIVCCAVLVALAGLVRYTSYSLALAIALYMLYSSYPKRQSLKYTFIFCLIFCLVSLFWWVPNLLLNGSPLATWQYLNIGKAVYPSSGSQWWWSEQINYESTLQLIKAYPLEYLENLGSNVLKSIRLLIESASSAKPIGYVLCIFLFFVFFRERQVKAFKKLSEGVKFLLFVSSLYVFLCSNAFVFTAALYPVLVVFWILLVLGSSTLLVQRSSYLISVFLIANLMLSVLAVNTYVSNQRADDGGQLASLQEVNSILSQDECISKKVVMSSHPARAYYSGSKWVMFPDAGYDDLCSLIRFEFPQRIKEYVPKIPVDLPLNQLRPNYLIVDLKLQNKIGIINDQMQFEASTHCDNQVERIYYNPSSQVALFRVLN